MAPIIDKRTPLVNAFFYPSFFSRTKPLGRKNEKPAVMPCAKPLSKNIMVPVEPTAAKASALTKRPTMIVSAIL